MSEQVQVCEGWWNLRDGRQVKVWRDTSNERRPWFGEHGGVRFSWMLDGRYHAGTNSPADLVEYLGTLPQPAAEPASEPQPVQVREGVWRTRDGREIVISLRDFGDAEPTSFVWFSKSTGEHETWLDNGRNTLSKFPQPLDLIEYLRPLPGTKAKPEAQPVQVREGVWLTRDGEEVEVRARDVTGIDTEWRWEGKRRGFIRTWRDDGTIHIEGRGLCSGDLVEFLQPLPETQPAPEPKPVQVRAGIWKTRSGREVEVRERYSLTRFRWVGVLLGINESWRDDGQWSVKNETNHRDLVQYVGPLPEPESPPEPTPKQHTTTDTLAEIEAGMAEIESDVAELVQQDETCRLQAELVLVTSERETLRADLTEVASERDALVREINEATTARDYLEQQLAFTTAERDNLAQRLVTKPSEEALQKRVGKQQIEINTLQDRLADMTTDRETLRRQFAAMTADRDRVQAELARETESIQNERFQAQTAHAGCKRAEENLADMTAERDRLAAEATDAQRLAADLRGEVDFVRGQKTAQEHQLRAEIARLERELRQARIEIDAEKEAPASNCRAVVDAHLIGAQTGRQAAFEAVERWLEPLAGVDSEHAAAILQALPGCIRKLAELEGVTL